MTKIVQAIGGFYLRMAPPMRRKFHRPGSLFQVIARSQIGKVIGSDFPRWRQIAGGAQCGVLVDPRRPESLAGAMEWELARPELGEEMGRRGRDAVRDMYNWSAQAARLCALYDAFARR